MYDFTKHSLVIHYILLYYIIKCFKENDMHVISVANKKGGVAKTSTSITMEAVLRSKGFKVLHIDADPQCNGSDTYKAKIEDEYTLYDAVLASKEERVPLSKCIQVTEIGDCIPGDPQMKNADVILAQDPIHSVTRMRTAIEQLRKDTDYDYVIIDTAPSEDTLLYNCLIASDEVIVPTEADRYGIQSVVNFIQMINELKESNPDLWIAGVLITRYNKQTNLSKSIRQQLTEILNGIGIEVFNTAISEGVKAKEASSLQTDLYHYARFSTPALNYQKFVDEYLEKEKAHYEGK